ncbi:hypothetical protein DL93DRAFT_2057318 [Clavulina sp. PMI_390]|nr:hypothetical protein DL93DRAFT_2057318 [Clavulina sp. PMI_390]
MVSSPPTDLADPSDSTPTNSEDEFDWEAEEDDLRKPEIKKATRIRRLWLLYSRLSRGIRLLLVGVLGAALLLAPYIVFHLRFSKNVAYSHVATWSIWLSISYAAFILTSLVVGLVPRFIIWAMFVLWGKAPETAKSYIELVMAVSTSLTIALSSVWLWIALSGVRAQIQPPGTYWLYVNRVVSALFAAGMLFFAEKLILRFIAIRFHRKALADRLLENQLALRALDKLSIAPTQSQKQAPKKRKDQKKPDLIGPNTPDDDTMTSLGPNRPPETVTSSDPPTRQQRRKRRQRLTAGVLQQLGGAIAEVALKDSRLNRAGEIGSVYSARQLARQLFSNLASVKPPRSYLIVEDFYPYFDDKDDAATAFSLFDQDGNGDISKKEMRNAVQRIYKERKALTASLKDMSSAVAKLDGVLLGVACLILLFVCLLIFNRSNTVESLVPLATLVLGFSFIFGHSAQLLFESLIFIFSTHPFDVGDLVIIDSTPLFVKEFGLYSTVFTRADHLITPNALLASSKLIHNVRRSGSMWESTSIQVAYDTPMSQVELLKTKLRSFMAHPENYREWGSPGCEIWIDKMDFQNDISLTVAIEHRANFQDWGGRWARRNKFMRHLKVTLEELNIGYRMPLQPVSIHPASSAPTNSFGSEASVMYPISTR